MTTAKLVKFPALKKEQISDILLKKEIETLLSNKQLQWYAGVMVLGSQLYSWAVHYIFEEVKLGSKEAKTAVLNVINKAMVTSEGNPRPFDEIAMVDNLLAIKRQLKKTARRHAVEAAKND